MAINTAARRAAVIGLSAFLFPPPEGTLSQPDRQAIARVYPGIAAAAPLQWDDPRASMINVGSGARVFPLPQGTLDASDRQHVSWLYRDILAGDETPVDEPVAGAPKESFVLPNGMRFRGTYAEAQALWSRTNTKETVRPAKPERVAKAAPVVLEAVTLETHETDNAENEQPKRTYYDALALLLLEA